MSWQFGAFVVAVGGVLYLVLRGQDETPATAAASTPSAGKTITKYLTKDVAVAGPERVVTRDVPSFTQGATKIVQGPTAGESIQVALAKSLGTFAAPLAPTAAGVALHGAGDFVQSGSLSSFSQGSLRSSGPGVGPLQPIADKVGDALRGIGDSLGSVTPLAGVFGVAAATQKWSSSQKQQTKIFGRAAETTVETGLGYVPIVGGAVAAVVKVLAGTYEGQRAVNNVLGRPIQQGYTVQKDLFNGDFKGISDVFGLGGSTHKERVASFYSGVTARLQQLDQGGGVISQRDLADFRQALGYGYNPAASGNHALPYLPGNADVANFGAWVNGLTVGQKFSPITTAKTQQAAATKRVADATGALTKQGFTAAQIAKSGGAEVTLKHVTETANEAALAKQGIANTLANTGKGVNSLGTATATGFNANLSQAIQDAWGGRYFFQGQWYSVGGAKPTFKGAA